MAYVLSILRGAEYLFLILHYSSLVVNVPRYLQNLKFKRPVIMSFFFCPWCWLEKDFKQNWSKAREIMKIMLPCILAVKLQILSAKMHHHIWVWLIHWWTYRWVYTLIDFSRTHISHIYSCTSSSLDKLTVEFLIKIPWKICISLFVANTFSMVSLSIIRLGRREIWLS